MKLVSKFALALSLVAVTAAPAFAQSDEKPKKEKKGKEATPAAPKKNYSKPFVAAYMPVANLLNKTKDAAAAKVEFPKIIAAIANDDDRYEAGILAINIGVSLKDTALQDQGIDLLLASASSSPTIVIVRWTSSTSAIVTQAPKNMRLRSSCLDGSRIWAAFIFFDNCPSSRSIARSFWRP